MNADIKHWLGKGLRLVVPIGCSALLVWWLFSKVHFGEMMHILRTQVEWEWIVLMMIITAFSHMFRGTRWGLQLSAAGIKGCKPLELWNSIFGDYAMNLLVPRLGEVWRIEFISRRQKASFSTVLGTVVGDRFSDMIVVILLIILTLFVASDKITDFLNHYAVGRDLSNFATNPFLWGITLAVIGVIWSVLHFFKNYKLIDKVDGAFMRIWRGFVSLFTMPRLGYFGVLTVGIWGCYFLETYVCFYAFPFTRELVQTPGLAWGLLPGLVSFVFSSCSMAIPSNGGLGPWNLAVMFALSLYGISSTQGAAFAMLVWSAQSVMLVLLGLWVIGCILWYNKRHPHTSASAKKSGDAK